MAHHGDCGCRDCNSGTGYGQHGGSSGRGGGGRRRGNRSGSWTPSKQQNPDVGVVEGTDSPVSFKTGGKTGDHTLIADGDYSEGDGTGAEAASDAFKDDHNHYGSNPGGGGYFNRDRGHYTGPDH